MIGVDRSIVAEPDLLHSPRVREAFERLEDFSRGWTGSGRQDRLPFESRYYRHPRLKDVLIELFRGKCAYCESAVLASGAGDVEHFRPKTGAIGLTGKPSPVHYWWLAYEWTNLYLACTDCNRAKGLRFPVMAERATPKTVGPALLAEQPVLLDPCIDDPEEHLIFSDDGLIASNTDRGKITIEVFNLNRRFLKSERTKVAIDTINTWNHFMSIVIRNEDPLLDAVILNLTRLLDTGQSYLALRRQLVRRLYDADLNRIPDQLLHRRNTALHELFGLVADQKLVTVDEQKSTMSEFEDYRRAQEDFSVLRPSEPTHRERVVLRHRPIERITIRNFRAIKHLEIEFPASLEPLEPDLLTDSTDPDALDVSLDEHREPWLMLLGENGTGKSSILQAVGLTLIGDVGRDRLGLDASTFVRHGAQRGRVQVWLEGSLEPIELTFRTDSNRFHGSVPEPQVLVLGFGATRLLSEDVDAPVNLVPLAEDDATQPRIDNLFNPFLPLDPPDAWLLELDDDDFHSIAAKLKDLLLLEPGDRIIRGRQKRRIEVQTSGHRVPLARLSDGYKSVVALVTGIMRVMFPVWPAIESAEGVVLVDELCAHLHPTWRMRVVERLRAVFPRIQFVATTHDPLALRGLRDGEVIVMQRAWDNDVIAITDLPSLEAMSVDQLLTSEHFGLNSTVDPVIDTLFHEYYALKAQDSLTAPEENRLEQLVRIFERKDLFGHSPRERLMLEVIDEYVAAVASVADPDLRAQLRSVTKRRATEIWANGRDHGADMP